jgi:hypothetical protein
MRSLYGRVSAKRIQTGFDGSIDKTFQIAKEDSMSRCKCQECGTGFATRPAFDCPGCGSGDIAIQEENSLQGLSGGQDDAVPVEKILKDMLLELAERIYDSHYEAEIWERIIDRTISNLKPYLRNDPVKI